MESLRLSPVVFCGENPHIVLYKDGAISAAASYWHSTYSAHGEGNALLLYLDDANAAALNQPSVAIYADNEPLARYLTDTFNQHFEDWDTLGFGSAVIKPAQFTKGKTFYQVAMQSDDGRTSIDLLWQDVRGCDFRTFPDLQGGGFGVDGDEHYDIANVISLCAEGSISVNQQLADGTAQTQILDNGRFSTSVFVALSEVWIKRESSN